MRGRDDLWLCVYCALKGNVSPVFCRENAAADWTWLVFAGQSDLGSVRFGDTWW